MEARLTKSKERKPVQRRVRLPREARMAEILVAAREVFTERGYEAAAMSEIAARVGVVEGAVYRFFSSKRELLMAAVCHWYDEIIQVYNEGMVRQRGLRERLRFMIWHHLSCIKKSPKLLNLFYQYIRMDPYYPGSDLFKHNRWYVNQLSEILKQGQASGELRGDIPLRMVRDMVFGLAEQRTIAYRAGFGPFDPDATADELTEFVLFVCAAPQSAAAMARVGTRMRTLGGELQQMADELGPGGGA